MREVAGFLEVAGEFGRRAESALQLSQLVAQVTQRPKPHFVVRVGFGGATREEHGLREEARRE